MAQDNGSRTRPTSIWLDDETKAIVETLGEELGLNRSELIREAIRRMVADDKTAEIRLLVAELSRAVSGGGDL